MDDLSTRLVDLYNSLGEYKAADHPTAALVGPYNALVDAAKQELGDDPVVQAIPRAAQMGSTARDNAGAMRASINQILSAMGESGPSIA